MQLIEQDVPRSAYLAADEVVDHGHPLVRETVAALGGGSLSPYEYARAAFEYIRDEIPHSRDSGDMRVTWRASDVLELRTGICYAKSHALAALLRARGIPTGFCYQRLTEDDGSAPVLHGLVAIALPGHPRWARQDARGNTSGIDARFSTEGERLAFPVRAEFSEVDYPVLYAAPHSAVMDALRSAPDRAALWQSLPSSL
ncbi:transglutaminase family protein [Streptomyces uncialis]|uniref:transglutaminase family protein n=1 Tax=Streptomyces uncialis TaxID=1048205 RepID=UPI0037BBD86A